MSRRFGPAQRDAALRELKPLLLATGDLAERLRLITDAVVRVFHADFARIWVLKEADLCERGCRHTSVSEGENACRDRTRCLHLVASSGRYTRIDGSHRRVPLGAYKIGRIASGEEPWFVSNDVAHDPRIHDRAWATALGLVAFAGCRLVSTEGSPVGVLAFFGTRPATPAELTLLQDLAVTASQVVLVGTTEQALSASETRWRVLSENAPAFIMTLDREGRILSLNRAFPGRTTAELVGTSVYDYPALADAEKIRAALEAVFERRARVEYEASYERRDGTAVWLLSNAAPVEQEGRVVAAIHVSIDISERKRVEQTLRDSEERYRHLLEGLPDGVLVVHESRIVFANAAAAHILGSETPLELSGLPAVEFVHPVDRAAARARVRRVAETGESVPLTLMRLQRRDGGMISAETVGLPIRHRGQPAVQLVFRDVTARKRAEAERNRFFELSLDMLCMAGFDGHFKELNPAWNATLGWDLEELKRQPWLDFVHPDDVAATLEAGRSLREGRSVMHFVNRYRCKDGSYRRLSWNSVSVPDEGLIFAVVRDVTDRLRLEEQLRQAEKMTALGQLAGGVAHDFNNQLAGILGYAELLRARVGENETLRRYAEGIVTGAQRSARLTQQLLAFARKGKYQVVPVDLHALLDEVLAILEHSIDKRIQIRRALAATPIQVVGDPAQLQNALLNLAINGRDAMPEGGELTLATKLVTVDRDFQQASGLELAPGRYGCVRISDTGVGMDEETRRRAFEPFFTTKEQGRGTGLGLSAAYGIVRNHLGALRLDSAVGRGTTVEVFLPLAQPAAEDPSAKPAPEEASFLRILLVDDEDLVRAATAEMLSALGHTVRECRNGREAVDVFSAAPGSYDLVIMDMIMPLMSGAEALTEMRTRSRRLRAILSSGYSLDDEAQRLLSSGSLVLIQKPFTISDLAEAIARSERMEG